MVNRTRSRRAIAALLIVATCHIAAMPAFAGSNSAAHFQGIKVVAPGEEKAGLGKAFLLFDDEKLVIRYGKNAVERSLPYAEIASLTSFSERAIAQVAASRNDRTTVRDGDLTGPVFKSHEEIKYQVIIIIVIAAIVAGVILLVRAARNPFARGKDRGRWLALQTKDQVWTFWIPKSQIEPIRSAFGAHGLSIRDGAEPSR